MSYQDAFKWLEKAYERVCKRGVSLSPFTIREALKAIEAPFMSEQYIAAHFGVQWGEQKQALLGQTKKDFIGPSFRTEEKLSDKVSSDGAPTVSGEAAWQTLSDRFTERITEVEQTVHRDVTVKTDKPIGIILLGDMHIGSASTDYPRLNWILSQLKRTDVDLYCLSIGDILDSMIWRKVMVERNMTPVDVPQELAAAAYWLNEVTKAGKMLAVVAGNHDLVSWKMTGYSFLDSVIDRLSTKIPYAPFEMLLNLGVGRVDYSLLLRHACRGGSMWNPAHAVSKQHHFDHYDSDIIVAGHTHRSGWQESILKGRKRLGIQLGAYKKSEYDNYALEQGFTFENIHPDYLLILDPNKKDAEVCQTEKGILLLEALKASTATTRRLPSRKTGPTAASTKSNTKAVKPRKSSAKASRGSMLRSVKPSSRPMTDSALPPGSTSSGTRSIRRSA